jgi:ATP-binding cassette subfamily B protein
MAHRNRLLVMGRYFEHVLSLPLSFHGDTQSGRLMKVHAAGLDNLFGLWLSFFREHLTDLHLRACAAAADHGLNWRLGLLLIAAGEPVRLVSAWVIRKTEAAQGQVEALHTPARRQRAGRAVQRRRRAVLLPPESRGAAVRRHRPPGAGPPVPVLNWWAVVAVLTRAASTITVILIFVLGTVLHLRGEATVGDIVSFMGFATLLITRLEGAVGFVSRLVFQMPALQQFFEVMDARTSVPEKPDAVRLPRVAGEVRSRTWPSPTQAARAS